MQVKLEECGIMITADTEFEEQYLRHNFGNQEGRVKAYLKHGVSACDLIGLKVFVPETFSIKEDYPLQEFEEFVAKLLLPEEHPLSEEQKKVAKDLFATYRGKTTILALLALNDSAFEGYYNSLKNRQKTNRRK